MPRRGLRSGHAQTIAAFWLPRRCALPPPEERLFRVDDGVHVLCHCHWQQERTRALTLLVVHGLEGSSESQYMLGTASKAWDAGMNVVRMNMRNCGGTEALGPTLYHSGMSGDVGSVAGELIAHDKLPRIGLAGFSMGGNQVLKLAGEWGREVPPEVRAIAAISPAMDLTTIADALHEPANRLYEWNFLWSLCRRVKRKARLYPDRYRLHGLPWFGTLRQFDDRITAPYSGFAGAEDYYQRAASAQVANRIALPTLVLHALDDPFIRMLPETRSLLLANPQVCLVEPEHGGHCGFLASMDGYDGRWAERQIVEFFKRF